MKLLEAAIDEMLAQGKKPQAITLNTLLR
jgi:hypothetical protein